MSDDRVWDALRHNKHWEDWKIEPNPLRQWDFYCTVGRKIERVLLENGSRVVLPQRLSFPASGSNLSPPWHRLTVPHFQDVHWRNEPRGHKLICNGILVFDKSEDYQRRGYVSQGFIVLRPTISVFDPDGMLPLNLQRTDLAARDPQFADALWESQSEDYIAWMLANAPSKPVMEPNDGTPEYTGLVYPPAPLLVCVHARGVRSN